MACDAFIECRSFPSQIHIWEDDYKIATAVKALMSLLLETELMVLCFESVITFRVPVPLVFVSRLSVTDFKLPFKNPLLCASLDLPNGRLRPFPFCPTNDSKEKISTASKTWAL